MNPTCNIRIGDWIEQLKLLPDNSVHCVVTSPPYWGLRDYGIAGQLGLETTIEEYISKMVIGFREVRRVLRDDGVMFLNLGDSYASQGGAFNPADWDNKQSTNRGSSERCRTAPRGFKPKDLMGLPWRIAFALQADGWYLRCDIIWHKPNAMPESVTDRPTKAHEYVFLLAKSQRYFYDAEAIKEPVTGGAHPRANGPNSRMILERAAGREDSKPNPSSGHVPGVSPKSTEPGRGIKANQSFHATVTQLVGSRNKRSVWTVPSEPLKEAHFATFPQALIEPMIQAGTSEAGVCPHCGAPWRRLLEKKPSTMNIRVRDNAKGIIALKSGIDGKYQANQEEIANYGPEQSGITKTIGWAPGCRCADNTPVPATVLDPFGGSGTTGLVANRLGRSAIIIELNPDYIAIAEKRTAQKALL